MSHKITSISLTVGMHTALNKRLKQRGMTRSEYVRDLLRRDGVEPVQKSTPSSNKTPKGARA